MPLPCVPTIKSLVTGLIWMSRTKEYSGILFFILNQVFPPSRVAKSPISVPKNNRFLFIGSSFILCAKPVNSVLFILVQVLPMSLLFPRYVWWSPYIWFSNVTYTSFLSYCEGWILLIQACLAMPDFATLSEVLVQVVPPFVVYCKLPSSVPIQIIFSSKDDSAIVKMVQWFSAEVLSALNPPLSSCACFFLSLVVKSGEIRLQFLPWSIDL